MPPKPITIKQVRIEPIEVSADYDVPEGYAFLDLVQQTEDNKPVFYAMLTKLPEKPTWTPPSHGGKRTEFSTDDLS